VLDAMAGRPHVLNLGHGIDRFTPIAHVEQLMAAIAREGSSLPLAAAGGAG
jgi:uroporphyrinogen-III decarboxylase